MARDITSAMSDAVTDDVVRPILFFKAELDSGTLYLWNGYREYTWDSHTWIGAGHLATVGEIEETTDIRAAGVRFTLSGIPSEFLAISLTENYQNRPVTLWLGALNTETGALIADPYQMFGGRIDTFEIEDSGQTGSISIDVENNLINLKRPNVRRYTNEDQRINYPDDDGLEYIAAQQNIPIDWGVPSVTPAAAPGAGSTFGERLKRLQNGTG